MFIYSTITTVEPNEDDQYQTEGSTPPKDPDKPVDKKD